MLKKTKKRILSSALALVMMIVSFVGYGNFNIVKAAGGEETEEKPYTVTEAIASVKFFDGKSDKEVCVEGEIVDVIPVNNEPSTIRIADKYEGGKTYDKKDSIIIMPSKEEVVLLGGEIGKIGDVNSVKGKKIKVVGNWRKNEKEGNAAHWSYSQTNCIGSIEDEKSKGGKVTKLQVLEESNTEGKEGEKVQIHDIQGKAHKSPLEGKKVTAVEGVVTAIENTDNFYMQDPNPDKDLSTSEGIYVYAKGHGLKAGELVSVYGIVKEYLAKNESPGSLTVTKIISRKIEKKGIHVMPDPILIGKGGVVISTKIIDNDNFSEFDPEEDAIDLYESLEGMYVKVNDPLITGQEERSGEIYVVGDNGQASKEKKTSFGGVVIAKDNHNLEVITIDDVIVPISDENEKYMDSNFKVKTGDKFSESIVGVMSYGFGKYKLLNVSKLPAIIDGGTRRETTTIDCVEDELTVATYTIENSSSKAENQNAINRAAKVGEAIVKNLNSPDIVGLIEAQNNGVDAEKSLQLLVDSIKAVGGKEYKYLNSENNKDSGTSSSAIGLAFIYRPDRVTFIDKTKGGKNDGVGSDAKDLIANPESRAVNSPDVEATTKSLVAEFEFKGQAIICIETHFSSKGGDQPAFGDNQPAILTSEAKRIKQAQVLNNFIENIVTVNSKANVICMGDLNDFEFSKSTVALKGNILTNMIEELPNSEKFSRVYQGNSEAVDHLLVSNHLKEKTMVDIVHINSMFIEAEGRVSDHDPLLAQIELGVKNTEPTVPKEPIVSKDIKIETITKAEELAKLKTGEIAKIKIKAINTTVGSKKATLVVALYDKENQLINLIATTEDIKASSSTELEGRMTMISGGAKVKCFVWDSLEKMKLLSNEIEVIVK